jgi:hypothetical protein
MRYMSNLVFGLSCLLAGGLIASQLVGVEASAQQQSGERSGLWEAEDCVGLSAGSGLFLGISGALLEELERLEDQGYESEANERIEDALRWSGLAANFAESFEAYCK